MDTSPHIFPHFHHASHLFFIFVSSCHNLPILVFRCRAATTPPPGNLKDRIAALQQHNGTPSPTASPTPPSRNASVTPPRGSLRDKIAKFERKGGVPIPRSSFGMGAPPPEDASTKSRELYGNRVAALGKERPTAPGNSGTRSVSSPAPISATPTAQISSDGNDTESSALLVSNATPHTVPPSPSPELRSSSGPVDMSDEVQQDTPECTNDRQENSIQRDTVPQRILPETDSGSLDTVIAPSKTSESMVSLVKSPSSAGPAVTTLSLGETPERVPSPQKPNSPQSLDHSVTNQGQSTPSSVESDQERLPIAKPVMSTVQTRITVEQVTIKGAASSPRASQLDRSPQNDSLTAPLAHFNTTSVPQLPPSTNVDSTEKLTRDSVPSASNLNKTKTDSTVNPNSASNTAFPSSTPVNTHPITGDLDDLTAMSLPPAPEAGRRSFSAVVHRSNTDKRPDSRHSTTSRTSTITSRPSSASFKTGTDGGVVRSKRNFKHLGAVTADPPAPLGAGDLADLLQDAAWLEQRLSDETTSFDVPRASGEEGPKAESGPGPLSSTVAKTKQSSQPVPAAATPTRSKGRGLTLGPLTTTPSANIPHSPVRLSTSTPGFQLHPASGSPEEVLPAPPKSSRRKYFSLRALRGSRLSMSSEMSSDDSAPVATPPSPTFDFSIPQTAQGHGNDTMSVRSMFSIRSNKSGKSESVSGSLRLSPRRVSRAGSFAERFLNRATKTKSLLDDPGKRSCLQYQLSLTDLLRACSDDAIPEQLPMLPPIIPETPGSLLSISPISGSSQTDISFDRNIFDAFPAVPSDVPRRPVSYLSPALPTANRPGNQDFRRSSTTGAPTSEKGGLDKPDWLRTRQEL